MIARFLPMQLSVIVALASASAAAQPPPSTHAGSQRIVHESWSFREGAPELISAFAQTADGYLWIGAEAGLYRFDGMRFELFRSAFGDRLQSTSISALAAADGGLWIGYRLGGFSYLKSGRVRNFSEATGTVTSFAPDGRGVTWAGTVGTGSGLWRLDATSYRRIDAAWNFPERPVVDLGFDRDGMLWVLTGVLGQGVPKDLYVLAPGGERFRKVGENLAVRVFTRDADGYVLTTRETSANDARAATAAQGVPRALPLLVPTRQFIDRSNHVWMTSDQPGVLRHPAGEPLADILRKMSPGNSEMYPLATNGAQLVDREGAVWIGGSTSVHRFTYTPVVQQELPPLPAPWFMVVADDGGAVWISAADGAGDSTLHHVKEGSVDSRKLPAGVYSFLYRAPDATLWLGGEGGLFHRVGNDIQRVELPPEFEQRAQFLVAMTHDGAGGYWVSFGSGGLYRLAGGTWTRYRGRADLAPDEARKSCPTSPVVMAYTDSLNRVWLGCTRSALAMLDGTREREFGPNDGLAVGNVTAFHGKGPRIWVGGEFGLQQFDGERFRTVRAADDEALRGISGIVETANGDLWLNGLGGIVRIPRAEIVEALRNPAHAVGTQRFDRRAGVPGLASQLRRMPTAVAGTDGRLWFPVTNGVVWIDPARVAEQTVAPPVSIQSISADDKVYEPGQPQRFSPATANVQLSYAAVSLRNPNAIRFRYRLQETDADWHEAGRVTSVSYRNLPPGTYHFDVQASDANGSWPDGKATAEFVILPAYYQTAWFRAACALLLLLVAFAAYRLRIRSLRRRFEMTLDARVGERTRIARDLHDTLLQSFHGLLLRFETASELLPRRPEEAKEVLVNAIDQASEAIAEGRDAVQGLRTSSADANELGDTLRALGEDLAKESQSGVTLRVETQGASRALHPVVRDEAFRVCAEALRNAFRHADARHIELELCYDDRQLRLRVRDDGKGIDPSVLRDEGRQGHFGLRGMRERAKLAGGKLAVWSAVDEGTEVELTIPGARAYTSASTA